MIKKTHYESIYIAQLRHLCVQLLIRKCIRLCVSFWDYIPCLRHVRKTCNHWLCIICLTCSDIIWIEYKNRIFNPFFPTVPTFAFRETTSLGIMGAPRVPPLNPSESIMLWEHYRLRGAPEVPSLCRETSVSRAWMG